MAYLDIGLQFLNPSNILVVEVDHDIVCRWQICNLHLWSQKNQAVSECGLVHDS
jgi:hypothetical protein